MKNKILMIATVLLLGLGFSCSDPVEEIEKENIELIPNTDDSEDEDLRPKGKPNG